MAIGKDICLVAELMLQSKDFGWKVAGNGKSKVVRDARFIHVGMDVLFLAATAPPGGTYDYNVHSMSDVTGSEFKQLTHLKGMTAELRVLSNRSATFVNSGAGYVLDISTRIVKALQALTWEWARGLDEIG
jgi:hypothetical protein